MGAVVNRKCVSTGVVRKNADTIFAYLKAVNLTWKEQTCLIKVYDWGSIKPIVIYSNTLKLLPNTFTDIGINISTKMFYEIRLDVPSRGLIVNALETDIFLRLDVNRARASSLYYHLIPLDEALCN